MIKTGLKYILPLLALYIMLNSCPQAAAAQSGTASEPAKLAPERNYEREAVTFPQIKKDNTSKQDTKNTSNTPKTSVITSSIIPMVVMGVVVLGIFLWIGLTVVKKILPGGKKLFSSPALEILGRTHFDTQKYLALVRVGTRVLIVGVSPNGFDQISEISDSEEVTDILSSAKPKTSTGQNLFYKMFQKQIQNREDSAAAAVSKAEEIQSPEDTGSEASSTEPDIIQRQQRIRRIRDMEA